MYSITKLSGGQQLLLGQKNDLIEAISLAVEYASEAVAHSEHKKKEHNIFVRKCEKTDTMKPQKAIVDVCLNFPTVARSTVHFWIQEN